MIVNNKIILRNILLLWKEKAFGTQQIVRVSLNMGYSMKETA